MIFAEFDNVESKLRSLKQSSTVEDRLQVLRSVIDHLHGPISPEDGYRNEDLAQWEERALPRPLLWWLEFAGKRANIFSHQNKLVLPDTTGRMKLDDTGRYVFYRENQSVYLWSIFPRGDDPEVWGKVNEDAVPWREEGMPLSEFLIGACLFEGIWQSPYMASAAWISQETMSKLKAEIPELPLAHWHWPSYPTRFFAHQGTFMVAGPNCGPDENADDAYLSVWVSSMLPGALNVLSPYIDDAWEMFEPD